MPYLLKTYFCLYFSLWLLVFSGNGWAADKRLIIGGKNFTEQYILAEIAKILLQQHGFDISLKTGVGSTLLRRSLVSGQVDLYFEYTGTAYTVYLKQKDRAIMADAEKVFNYVQQADAKRGLVWLFPLECNTTYTLMMQAAHAQNLGIASISDLARYVKKNPQALIFGMNAEFWGRPDGFKRLMQDYGFRVPIGKIRKMATGLCYTALKGGQIHVSMGFSTDGRIAAFGFINLQDNQQFFPVYNPAPVVRGPVLKKYPEIQQILKVMSKLSTEDLQQLNRAVDVDKISVQQAALAWLKSSG
ncbi:MAG: glycine betaine ABC transporter substrate-binding protein [Desulfobacca sp.]|nr:glycine betaine ABC transporter substrate-binding protein [Desulfobacca sp.]